MVILSDSKNKKSNKHCTHNHCRRHYVKRTDYSESSTNSVEELINESKICLQVYERTKLDMYFQ